MKKGRLPMPEITGANVGLFALLGLATGILSKSFGVGGGIVMVPGFVFLLGANQKSAQAMSLAIIIPTALAGLVGYVYMMRHPDPALAASEHVHMSLAVAAIVAVFAVTGAFLGQYVIRWTPNAALQKAFGVFVIVVGVYMLWRPAKKPQQPTPTAPPAAEAGVPDSGA